MTKKEMKNFAKQFAKLELAMRNAETPDEKYQAEQAIINLTNKINDFEAMMMIDEMVLQILENN